MRTAPRGAEQFHWHVDLAPRLTIKAGFELGTGVDINIYPPERAASDLREALRRLQRMAPNPRPIPRFIADTSQEGIPHGRFAERLREVFRKALRRDRATCPRGRRCRTRSTGSRSAPGAAASGFPARPTASSAEGKLRALRSRLLRPAGRRASRPTSRPRPTSPTSSPRTTRTGGSTSTTTSIGRWRGENGRAGDVTLIWGRPLVRGAVAATAELDGETVDQEPISQDRFTLIALDALEDYGDDVFIEVKLWSRRAIELASETLYS